MKSFMASPATIERKWYVVDATGYTLGRLASEVAKRPKCSSVNYVPFLSIVVGLHINLHWLTSC